MQYRTLTLLLSLAACSSPDSPEQQVRNVIGQMEVAAEARDVGDLIEHVSDEYQDVYGQSQQDVSRSARGYFIAHQSIHLLTRIESIDFPTSDEARAKVLVGMAGRDAASWDLAADVYEFDVTLLREDDDWKVSSAKWKSR